MPHLVHRMLAALSPEETTALLEQDATAFRTRLESFSTDRPPEQIDLDSEAAAEAATDYEQTMVRASLTWSRLKPASQQTLAERTTSLFHEDAQDMIDLLRIWAPIPRESDPA